MKTEKMKKAFALGISAFELGIRCAPVNDERYMELIYGNDMLTGETAATAKAWLQGWTFANIGDRKWEAV